MSTRDELRGAFVGILVGALLALVLVGLVVLLINLFGGR